MFVICRHSYGQLLADWLDPIFAALLINKDNHFFVEGKKQLGFLYNDFPKQVFDREKAGDVVDSSVLYSLDFDLLTPPYRNVMEVSVNEVTAVSQAGKMKTGKRLGFRFQSEGEVK